MKRILGILLLCGCLAGCARGGSGNIASLSGNWQFTVTSTNPSVGNFTLSGTLQESSNSPATGTVTGSLTVDQTLPGPLPACSGPLTYLTVGSISGSTVALVLVVDFISFTGTANSDLTSMSGSYAIPSQANGAACDAGDYGTWSATKTS